MEVKPGYKQTEVGVIPEEWEVRPLLSTVRIANGQVSPKIEPYRSMILVAPDHIESSTGRLLAKHTAAEQQAISGKYVFESGDIVYSKIRPYLRKAILANFSGLCSADMYPLKPASDVSSGFILAVILGYHFSKYAESVSVRSGMPKINRTELAEYSLALPPLPEQRAIAEALSDVDALLAVLDRLIAKQRNLKQATMQQLLTGQTRLPGEWVVKPGYKQTEAGVISEDWEVRRLDSLGEGSNPPVKAGPFGSSLTKDIYVPIGYKIYGQEQVIRGDYLYGDYFITQKKYHELESCAVQPGDILLSLVGTIGRLLVIPDNAAPGVINPRLIRFSFNKRLVYPQFFKFLFESGQVQGLLARQAQGGTMGVLNAGTLRSFYIPLPSLAEQTAIATVLTDMDAELTALEQRRDKTRLLKQAMMQELLMGRTRLVG